MVIAAVVETINLMMVDLENSRVDMNETSFCSMTRLMLGTDMACWFGGELAEKRCE
jgi:hypothetical protein